ncbi:MAG: hypoxanthine phosphoribosyltransferase [Lachnospiraceae bacterium]|nr:hypoxanthine phosphoribosyltransferase [Lachnospiraceae bacterium]MBP3297082.1 hypoxanthine phosphoribosyltransferase [Lachnospiraceae bacterium]
MADTIKVLISEEQVKERIKELGAQISREYEGKSLHLICILKGSIFFTCELARYITVPVTLDFITVSSYGNGKTSTGKVSIVRDLTEGIQARDVLVIEDIVDTGRTLSYLMEMLKERNPASIKLCTLLDKPNRRTHPVDVEYVGFEVPDEFIVGWGLDYAQNYRNLPYIGILGDEE